MKSIRLLFLCAAAAWIPASAQRSDTVTQVLATDQIFASGQTLGPVRNIGQAFHQVTVVFRNQPVKTCGIGPGNQSPYVKIIGAFTGAAPVGNVSVPLPTRSSFSSTSNGSTTNAIVAQAAGAFPYLYVLVDGWDFNNCTVSVFYNGSLYPMTPGDPNVTGAISSNGAALSRVSGVGSVGLPLPAGNLFANVYKLTIINDGTAAAVVNLKCGAATIFIIPAMTPGQKIDFPYDGVAWFSCGASGGNVFSVQPAVAGSSVLIYYRAE